MLRKKMLKKGDKLDHLSILFGSANKNSSLRIKLSVALATQAATARGTHSGHYAALYQYTN